jgi:transcriptional regulator with XRE-family HTH domain
MRNERGTTGWDKRNAVKAARAINSQTQADLAELLTEETGEPWTRDMVQSLESGRKKFDVDILEALVVVQNLDYSFYLNGPTELNVAKGGYLQSFQPAFA